VTILDLLADGSHPRSSVRFLPELEAPARPMADLWAASSRAAGWVRRHHGAEAVVLTTLTASFESVAALVGAWRAGAAVVSFPGPARGQDLPAYRSQLEAVCRTTGADRILALDPADALFEGLGPPVTALAELLSADPWDEAVDGGRLVQFTSGTTGDAKGIVLGLDAVAANVTAILDRLGMQERLVSCSWLPLSHDMGLIGMCLAPWASFGRRWLGAGELILIPTETFARNPSIWLRACSELEVTGTTAPTFGYDLVARRLNPGRSLDLSRLRVCIVGAEPVPAATLRGFAAATEPFGFDPTSLCPAYGLAEAVLAVSLQAPGRHWRSTWLGPPDHPGSLELVACGPPLEGTDVEVRDADEQGVGRLHVRGPSLFEGYAGRRPRSPGWHDTGDLGFIQDGDVFVTGRGDDLLFVGGLKLPAGQIEQAAERVPGLRPDAAAAVQASSNAYAVVLERRRGTQARAGAEDLARGVREAIVAAFGRGPAEVVIVGPGTLPRTPSGKVRRSRVREQLAAGGLEAEARVVFRSGPQAPTTIS
jgi:acyl-CoA synthetase (AMP-forming)/AMP-acid ligase II